LNPGRRGGKPATTSLSYGAACEKELRDMHWSHLAQEETVTDSCEYGIEFLVHKMLGNS
jgi:hypothetical protein